MNNKEMLDTLVSDYSKQAKLSKREMKIYEHGILTGVEIVEHIIMKDAVEQDVDSIWANPINTLERLGLQNLNGKVKLIIIKQEEK